MKKALEETKQIFETAKKIYATFNYCDGSELDIDAQPPEKMKHNEHIVRIAEMIERLGKTN